MKDLGIIENGAVVIEEEKIVAVDTTANILKKYAKENYTVVDATGKCVTPGFVDSHTHFIFGGYRADEYSWRLEGMPYMEIMNRGGGIITSVKGTREASIEELVTLGRKRLNSMLGFGVTTVEGKSGYGLDLETELKQLEVMKVLNEDHVLDVVSTFMAAHAIPAEYKGRSGDFIDLIINEMLPVVAEKKLATFCDVFTEDKVFSIEESRKLLNAAKEHGFIPKMHADEIVPLGGAELAAEVGAVSADHLLQASDLGIKRMAEANVVATALPCTAFSLKEDYARARDMIDAGCAVALATDFNPGSCFTESIPLVIALATLYMGMTAEETLTALTINGAAAIGKADTVGSLDIGKYGDVLIHEFPSYRFLPYHIAVSTVDVVIKKGAIVLNKSKMG